MTLQTAVDSSENSVLTHPKKPSKCAVLARWRSGDAEDCKSSANRPSSPIVCSFRGLFWPRYSVGFASNCKLASAA